MRLLAFETSTRQSSLALLEDQTLVSECELPSDQRTTEALIPCCQQQLSSLGWRAQDLDLICVSVGPGSFTGLRIGVVTAKTLAFAVNAELIAVETMQVLAAQVDELDATVTAISDAQRRQLYAQSFSHQDGQWAAQDSLEIIDVETLLNREWQRKELLTGPGLTRIASQLPSQTRRTNESVWRPRAETVGALGLSQWRTGQRDDMWSLKPLYVRRSAAEEKLDAQGSK